MELVKQLAMNAVIAGALVSSAIAATAPARADHQPPPATKKPAPKQAARPYEIGVASWYGSKFDGKPTASGETYDSGELTAAHRRLPIGSWVKVTNLKNRKWVLVRINDRGPVIPTRIIDLSYSAARMLGIRGIATVRLDVMKDPGDSGSMAMLNTGR